MANVILKGLLNNLILKGYSGGTTPTPTPVAAPEIRKAIRARLLASSRITGIVGAAVYPSIVPQRSVFPCVCFGVVSNVRGHNLKGASGIAVARVQIEPRGFVLEDVASLKMHVENALDGYTGTVAGVTILASNQLNDFDNFDRPQDGSDNGIFRVVLDYRIKYRCQIPTF